MRTCLSAILLCLIAGCGRNSPSNVAEPVPDAPDVVEEKPMEIRTSLEGRWAFDLVREMSAMTVALIDVKKNGDVWEVTASADTSRPDAPRLKSGTATAQSIELTFDVGQVRMVYTGRLKDGVVRGSAVFDGSSTGLGMLLPSEAKSIGPPQPSPLPHFIDYQTIGRADDPPAELKKFVEQHPDSALGLDGFQKWLLFAKKEQLSADDITAIVADFKKSATIWGPPRLQMVPMDVAVRLASQNYQPELAAKFLQEFRDSLTEEQSGNQQLSTLVKSVESSIGFSQNIRDLNSGDAQAEANAVAKLGETLTKNPVNGSAILALANYYRDKSDLDNAIRYYSRLIAIPTLERTIVDEIMAKDPSASLPSQQLTELWQKRDGNLSGLDNYLNQVYRETFAEFVKDENKHAARAAGSADKVALFELMTGAQCPPCIAADLALDVLANAWEPSELIVVRYHQHIPGPDPLANRDSNRRFTYYNAKGTPSLFLNGFAVGGVAGSLDQFAVMTPALNGMVEKVIAEKSGAAFELKAVNDGQKVSISASVSNVDDSDGGEYYLRLVLTESDIVFKAANGIRIHNMVARAMPGGYRGLAVKDGKAQFTGEVSITELQQAVQYELDRIEQYQNSRLPGRPLEFTNLRLVATVQDDVDRRIIQSQVIDVIEGEPVGTDQPTDAAEDNKEPAAASETDKTQPPEKADDDKAPEDAP